jgi:hypothetical protein
MINRGRYTMTEISVRGPFDEIYVRVSEATVFARDIEVCGKMNIASKAMVVLSLEEAVDLIKKLQVMVSKKEREALWK